MMKGHRRSVSQYRAASCEARSRVEIEHANERASMAHMRITEVYDVVLGCPITETTPVGRTQKTSTRSTSATG